MGAHMCDIRGNGNSCSCALINIMDYGTRATTHITQFVNTNLVNTPYSFIFSHQN